MLKKEGLIEYFRGSKLTGNEQFEITHSSDELKYDISINTKNQNIRLEQRFDMNFVPKSLHLVNTSKENKTYTIDFNVKNNLLKAVMRGEAVGTISQEILLPPNTRVISHPLSVDGMLFDICGEDRNWRSYPCYYLSNQGWVGNIGILMENRIRFLEKVNLPDFHKVSLHHYQIQCDLKWPIDEPVCDFFVHPEYHITYYSSIILHGERREYKLNNISVE